jgi:DNA-binding NtrC family response regulator
MAVSPMVRLEEPDERYLPCVSPKMQVLAASLSRVAATQVPVLICGETGSGKSALARQLHEDGPRREAPLVIVLGATARPGNIDDLAQLADRTIVIEEVGDLVPAAQDRLMRLLTEQHPRRSLQLITTTSCDLAALVARQSLRADLLYRLDVVRLDIPPLRQRREDIIFLAEHFLVTAAHRFRRDVRALSPDAHARLLEERWPGNVRELSNCITESVLHCKQVRLRAGDLRLRGGGAPIDLAAEFADVLARFQVAHPHEFHLGVERLILQWALDACEGNRIRAATLLGIGRGSLRAKLRRHGLDGPVTDTPGRDELFP